MRFLDTNIFLRYLVRDDADKATACYQLLHRVDLGQEQVTTCEAVIAETVYVLSSRSTYNLSRSSIRERLRPILTLAGLRLPEKRTYLLALDLYVAHPKLDFEDALIVAHMHDGDIQEVISYDGDFDRVPGIRRIEPPSLNE